MLYHFKAPLRNNRLQGEVKKAIKLLTWKDDFFLLRLENFSRVHLLGKRRRIASLSGDLVSLNHFSLLKMNSFFQRMLHRKQETHYPEDVNSEWVLISTLTASMFSFGAQHDVKY